MLLEPHSNKFLKTLFNPTRNSYVFVSSNSTAQNVLHYEFWDQIIIHTLLTANYIKEWNNWAKHLSKRMHQRYWERISFLSSEHRSTPYASTWMFSFPTNNDRVVRCFWPFIFRVTLYRWSAERNERRDKKEVEKKTKAKNVPHSILGQWVLCALLPNIITKRSRSKYGHSARLVWMNQECDNDVRWFH